MPLNAIRLEIPQDLRHIFSALTLMSDGTVALSYKDSNTFVQIETLDNVPVTLQPVNVGVGVIIRKEFVR